MDSKTPKLTPAEKQRRYRQNRDNDPEKRAKYLLYEKDKYLKDKEDGKKKNVSQMTPREHRAVNKRWKKNKISQRCKQKSIDTSFSSATSDTTTRNDISTPTIPTETPGTQSIVLNPSTNKSHIQISRQKLQYFETLSADKKALCLELKHKDEIIGKQERKISVLSKRNTRQNQSTISKSLTPSSKAKILSMKKDVKSSTTVRRALTFHFAVVEQIKKAKKKKFLKEIAKSDILRKYKLKTAFCKTAGIKAESKKTNTRIKKSKKSEEDKIAVKDFFLRSDNCMLRLFLWVNKLQKTILHS